MNRYDLMETNIMKYSEFQKIVFSAFINREDFYAQVPRQCGKSKIIIDILKYNSDCHVIVENYTMAKYYEWSGVSRHNIHILGDFVSLLETGNEVRTIFIDECEDLRIDLSLHGNPNQIHLCTPINSDLSLGEPDFYSFQKEEKEWDEKLNKVGIK
jgi:hypothetical protein